MPAPLASPERALLHPAWWLALALLAVNDHLLKGAGVLPGLVTGKLSDLAGLFLAPALLAALVRARRTPSRLACHVAVGAVFAALQLSGEAGALWNALLGLAGLSWHIWPDPTDLVALVALPLAWRVLGPIQHAPLALRRRASRTVQAAALVVGCGFCLATSPPEAEPRCCTATPIFADVLLHNSSGRDLAVRVRELSPAVALDCARVATDPARHLAADALFEPARTWNVPPWTTLPAREGAPLAERGCHAARVEASGLPARLLFWSADAYPSREVGGYFDRELGQEPPAGTVLVESDDGGDDESALRLDDQGQALVYALAPGGGGFSGERCEALRVADAQRLAWSEPLPPAVGRVVAVEAGLDGCLAVDLADPALDPATAPVLRWYVCLPQSAWPFVAGDVVRLAALPGGAGLRVVRLAVDDAPVREEVLLTRDAGQTLLSAGLAPAVVLQPDEACALEREVACGTLSRGGRVAISPAAGVSAAVLEPGQSARFELEGGATLEAFAVVAAERPLVHATCSQGPATTGPDVELVLHYRAP